MPGPFHSVHFRKGPGNEVGFSLLKSTYLSAIMAHAVVVTLPFAKLKKSKKRKLNIELEIIKENHVPRIYRSGL